MSDDGPQWVSEFSGVVFPNSCKTTFDTLSMGKKLKWIVYKINNAKTGIEVEETSEAADYDALRASLLAKTRTTRGNEKPDARYAVMDIEHDVGGGEGKRSRIVFIVWIPDNAETAIKLIYSTSKDALTRACGLHYIIEAHDEDDLEYDNVLSRAKLN